MMKNTFDNNEEKKEGKIFQKLTIVTMKLTFITLPSGSVYSSTKKVVSSANFCSAWISYPT